MVLAYAEDDEQEEDDGPDLLQIDTSPRKMVCRRCGQLLIEAHFWRRPGTQYIKKCGMWSHAANCSYCRAGMSDPKKVGVDTVHRQRERAFREARERNKLELTSYVEDNQRRCKVCKSTIYRDIVLVHSTDYPSAYIVEWLCWSAGHVILEQWKIGSPVGGRFPISEIAPTMFTPAPRKPPLAPLETSTPIGTTMNYVRTADATTDTSHRRLFSRSMQTIPVDVEVREGCDSRCEILRYRDANTPDGPILLRRIHNVDAHNTHRANTGENRLVIGAMELDFDAQTCTINGQEIMLSPIEWKILITLAHGRGRTIRHDEILLSVWGPEYTAEVHLLRVSMARLRAKIEPPKSEKYIKTRPGIGYMMRSEHEKPSEVAS